MKQVSKTKQLTIHADYIQDLLDEGRTIHSIASELGAHRNQVARIIKYNNLEVYEAFDEVNGHLSSIFTDWDFEDVIDEWLRDALNDSTVVLPKPQGRLDIFTLELYRFIKESYGGIRPLLNLKARHIRDNFLKECSKCGNALPLSDFSNNQGHITGLSSGCRKCNYSGKSLLALRSSGARRRAYTKELPSVWGEEEYRLTNEIFGGSCALTNEGSVDYDHFIPIATGHAGTIVGNMYPLEYGLNRRKSDANPFDWFEADRKRFELDQSRFDSLVAKLAEQNGLTTEEFREYTDWCFANPRNLTQIKRDNARYGYRVTSVELWREATGRQRTESVS